MRAVVLQTLLLLLVGPAIGLIVNALRFDGVSMAHQAEVVCEATAGPIEEVSPEMASDLCGSRQAVIVDVRSEARYERGHIPRALHLPCTVPNLDEASEHLRQAETVIVYGDDTEEAQQVATSLMSHGLSVRVLAGGYRAWEQAGLACASGPCTGCLGAADEH